MERKRGPLSGHDQDNFRNKMLPMFIEMKDECIKLQPKVMPGSSLNKAINYFLNHFSGLTVCTQDAEIPLDNNLSERNLRPPVVGRKTWYGSHSKRGAATNAALFSIVQSCKLNSVNPRKYFPWVVKSIHHKKEILTPYQYSIREFSEVIQ